ncbi:MAG TPA: alpha/beta fold hydrolase [Jatrophihabitans sp.]|jgi:pimeloyl-ACP methyl ester carboxylesterase
MPTLTRNGATISYTDTGAPSERPDAATVVFGHGLLFSGRMFQAQVEVLRTHYRCVTIDWRGQGDTPATRSGYDMDTLTDDALAVIESLDAGPVHYVGLSMGGFVGQRLAARHGRVLRSLTLLDTSADREPTFSILQDIAMAYVHTLVGMRPLAPFVLPIMFGPTFRKGPANEPAIAEFLDGIARTQRAGLRRAVLAVALRKPVYDELDRIPVPTLVIVGADDVATKPEKAQRVAARVPGARLEIVPNSGHSSTVEQPAAVTALIEEFLASV